MTPSWFRFMTEDRGVNIARRILGLGPDGDDDDMAQRVRGVQKVNGIPVTGDVDEKTASVIGESSAADATPSWFRRDLQINDEGEDVLVAGGLLGLESPTVVFDRLMDDAVRRVQSANGICPNGIIGLDESKLIGDI